MSGSLGEAVLDLSADNSGLEKDIENSKGGVLNVLNGLGTLGGKIFMAAIAAVIAGSVVIGKVLSESVKEAIASEEVQAQLEAVLTSTGGAAGVTAGQVNELATSLSQLTKFDDEAIVSAESILLTFTNIGSNVFPQATETVLDMSQALGQDLQSSSIQLGKALNDPINGVTALRRVGVQFTDEQEKMIKSLVEAGKLEEAQAMILKELQTEFGGSAEAAGKTFAGQLAILQTNLGNIKETIGMALLPVLSELAKMFGEYLNRPETKQFIADFAKALGEFAMNAVQQLPAVIQMFKDLFGWLMDNQGVIVGVLTALGAAVAVFLWTTLAPMLPIIAVMALIGAAAYLLYTAWTENWGGIRDAVMQFWTVIQPYFQQLVDWLQIWVPIALQGLANWWSQFLLPIIQNFFAFLATQVFPRLAELVQWLATNIPAAIQSLVNWWNTLKTNVSAVWTAISTTITSLMAKIGIAISIRMYEIIGYFNHFKEVADRVQVFIQSKLTQAWDGLAKTIGKVVNFIQDVIDAMKKVGSALPDWLIPGSPTPFEIGLWGINDALKSMARASLPTLGGAFQSNLAFSPAALNSGNLLTDGASAGSSRQYIFNMGNTVLDEDQLRRALSRAEVLNG